MSFQHQDSANKKNSMELVCNALAVEVKVTCKTELDDLSRRCSLPKTVSLLLVDDAKSEALTTQVWGRLRNASIVPPVEHGYDAAPRWFEAIFDYFVLVVTCEQCVAQALVERVAFDVVCCDLRLDEGIYNGKAMHNGGFHVWNVAVNGKCRDSNFWIYTGNSTWLSDIRPLISQPLAVPKIYGHGDLLDQVADLVDDVRKTKIRRESSRSPYTLKLQNDIANATDACGLQRVLMESHLAPLLAPEARKAGLVQFGDEIKRYCLSHISGGFREFISGLCVFLLSTREIEGGLATPRHYLLDNRSCSNSEKWTSFAEWYILVITNVLSGVDEVRASDQRSGRKFSDRFLSYTIGDVDSCKNLCDDLLELAERYRNIIEPSSKTPLPCWFEGWNNFRDVASETMNGENCILDINRRMVFWQKDLDDMWRVLDANALKRGWQRTAKVLDANSVWLLLNTPSKDQPLIGYNSSGDRVTITVQTDDKIASDDEVNRAEASLAQFPPRDEALSQLRFLVCEVYLGEMVWASGMHSLLCIGSSIRRVESNYNVIGVCVQISFPML